MVDFQKEVFKSVKTNLAGLNSFSRLVIYELLSYCDYQTGKISIDALDVVARDNFYVAPSPGRKKEVITGDTVFRSIKKAKPGHFIFTTANQRIVITMPFICELYQFFIHNEESSNLSTLTFKAMEANHGRIKDL